MKLDLVAQEANIARWMQRWEEEVKGAGGRLAWIDSTLSLLFAMVVLVFLISGARRIFRSEGGRRG
jgi:hypothetical protein